MVQILRRDVSMLERRMETAESIGDHGVLRKRRVSRGQGDTPSFSLGLELAVP